MEYDPFLDLYVMIEKVTCQLVQVHQQKAVSSKSSKNSPKAILEVLEAFEEALMALKALKLLLESVSHLSQRESHFYIKSESMENRDVLDIIFWYN